MIDLQAYNNCRLKVVSDSGVVIDLGRIKSVSVNRDVYLSTPFSLQAIQNDTTYTFTVYETDPIIPQPEINYLDGWEDILQGDYSYESEQSNV